MKNKIKCLISLVITILAQYLAVLENGHWIAGGNILAPVGCWLLLWFFPAAIKEMKGSCK